MAPHPNAKLTNDEGLTFEEWLAAAGYPEAAKIHFSDRTKYLEDWRDNEDPTEHKAKL